MLRHLIRTAFIDSVWGAADLNEAADFWVRLFEVAARKGRFGDIVYHAVEVRLQGFPRHQAEVVRDAFARRLADGDFPDPHLLLTDADTLVFSSGYAPLDQAPVEGLVIPCLAGAPFDGLLVELRFTVAAFRRERVEAFGEGFRAATHRPVGKSKAEGTLVLVGELRDGRLHLKAAWRRGPFDDDNEIQLWNARWGNEAAWLKALETFGESGAVPKRLAMGCFLTRGSERFGRLQARLIYVPHDRPRLGGLVWRLAFFALVTTPLVLLMVSLEDKRVACLTLLFMVLALSLVMVFFAGFLACELCAPLYLYWRLRRIYRHVYAATPRVVPLTPEEAATRLDHPWARKLSGDLEAAGCTHLGDFHFDPPAGGEMVTRIYRTADPGTIVQLLLQTSTPPTEKVVYRMWPAEVILAVGTWFRDGSRCGTVCGERLGFRRKLTGPESREQVLPEGTALEEVLRRHRQMTESFARDGNRTPEPVESADDVVRLYQETIKEDRRLYGARPYTFGDHLHWWLQIRRREYRA